MGTLSLLADLLKCAGPMNMAGNAVVFSVSSFLFLFSTGSFDPRVFLLGLAGFLLSYSFVYFYNDYCDRKSDAKDRKKARMKSDFMRSSWMGGGGNVVARSAFSTALLATGLSLAYLVGPAFLAFCIGMLLTNFLHSYPRLGLKRRPVLMVPNFFVMQILKFGCGWVAQAGGLAGLPVLSVGFLAASYTSIFTICKRMLRSGVAEVRRVLPVSVALPAALLAPALWRPESALLLSFMAFLLASSLISFRGASRDSYPGWRRFTLLTYSGMSLLAAGFAIASMF